MKHVITRHFCLTFVIVQLLFDKFGKAIPKCIKQVQISELHSKSKMASALGNLMANYTDSEGEELAEGGSEGERETRAGCLMLSLKCLNFYIFQMLSLKCFHIFHDDSSWI